MRKALGAISRGESRGYGTNRRQRAAWQTTARLQSLQVKLQVKVSGQSRLNLQAIDCAKLQAQEEIAEITGEELQVKFPLDRGEPQLFLTDGTVLLAGGYQFTGGFDPTLASSEKLFQSFPCSTGGIFRLLVTFCVSLPSL